MPIHPVVQQWIGSRISHNMVVFGSDRFQTSSSSTGSSDVDIAVFLPKHCSREAFFQVFEAERPGEAGHVFQDVVVVRHAFVPVVKFRYLQQSYDVVPICTNTSTQATAYSVADLVDEVDHRGFSAVVTTDVILSTIGPLRMACFQQSLDIIKKLARDSFVYSNPLGLFNGVALAVMLTAVFVTAPRSKVMTPESTVATFFETFAMTDDGIRVDLLTTPPISIPGGHHRPQRRPMQVFIPVQVGRRTNLRPGGADLDDPRTPSAPPLVRINALHNVGPAQFRRIQAFLNRPTRCPTRNPFTMSEFFIHFHIFAAHDDFPRFRTQFESTLKRVISDIEEPEWAHVDVFSHEPFVFRSVTLTRASFFLGVAFKEDKLDLLLGVISNFCVSSTTPTNRVCSDLFHRRALPSFVHF